MILNTLKKLRPRKRHLRYIWIGLVVLAGLSFLVGQVAIYLIY